MPPATNTPLMNTSTLMPPRTTADAQFTFRAETPVKVELEAIAATLDQKPSELLRDILLAALPALRAKAEEAVKEREKLPKGITPEALDAALASLMRRFTRGEPIHLEPQDLLAPESKAVWVFLSFLWSEDRTDDLRERMVDAIADLASAGKPVKIVADPSRPAKN
jgi:hypothetical protein